MLGWINDCVEKLVIKEFGVDAWHIVKQKAGCDVGDGAFYKLDHYSDQSTVDLVAAASQVSGLTVDQIYEAFGVFFVHYIREEGYDNLLCCQGSTLKDWMTNINAIHHHLQTTFPKKMIMPQFWCEDGGDDGSLLLHYHSRRGNFLAPLAKGLVAEIAQFQFELDIDMSRTQTQAVDGAKFTSWHITTKDPADMWKLKSKEGGREGVKNVPTTFKCPFTGMTGRVPSSGSLATLGANLDGPPAHLLVGGSSVNTSSSGALGCPLSDSDDEDEADGVTKPAQCPYAAGVANPATHSRAIGSCPYSSGKASSVSSDQEVQKRTSIATSIGTTETTDTGSSHSRTSSMTASGEVGISPTLAKVIFPYHLVVDQDFKIVQIGNSVASVLQSDELDLVGQEISEILEVTKPFGMEWSWKWLTMMEDQPFDVEPVDQGHLRFKATALSMVEGATGSSVRSHTMLILTPDANNLNDLRDMNLTLSDLPAHGAHRDAVFLREHLSTQMNNALKMEKLSRTLEKEKDLLHSLLPAHAAEGLRTGQTVEPRLHNDVTFFFSDIKGFTSICDQIYPWEVISMLNQLYGIMDALAEKFNVFKIETIGDAYVCCSGLPEKNPDHAKNVANFALAVQHCCKMVKSPVDGTAIQLRIGLHTGPCASGIVGKTNPRYCVFGDTVNTCSRHESSGVADKIHVSVQTARALRKHSGFRLARRGMVEMKGKGELKTYWLNSSACVNNDQMYQELDSMASELMMQAAKVGAVAKRKSSLQLQGLSTADIDLSAASHSYRDESEYQSCKDESEGTQNYNLAKEDIVDDKGVFTQEGKTTEDLPEELGYHETARKDYRKYLLQARQ